MREDPIVTDDRPSIDDPLADKPSPDGRAERRMSTRSKRMLRRTARRITSWTRMVAIVPSIGLLILGFALSVKTLMAAIDVTIDGVVLGHDSILGVAARYIEYADLFLLSVALYLMSLGLFTLFVSDRIPLPKWLRFSDFDDLKERLISVICVMIGVFFLGRVLEASISGIDLLWLGLASSVVICALTVFVKLVIDHRAE
ncbi:YqhA family protein [Berryella wangjianweii]|nr:YqhA family protein [Berryella wangjianweii]